MEKLFFIILMICVGVSIYSMTNAYFPNDETSRKKVKEFIWFKGIFYFALVVITIIEEVIKEGDYSLALLLTICIAIFEAAQNIIQTKADSFIEEVNEKLENAPKKDNTLKDIKRLYMYCQEQLDSIKREPTMDRKQLVYEKIYDYLKYYSTANDFLSKLEKYRNGECTLEEVGNSLDKWEDDFKGEALEIVKLPEY